MNEKTEQKKGFNLTVYKTLKEFKTEAIRRFGPDFMEWKFVCPVCKRVTSVREWFNAGAKENQIAFSCIGRFTSSGCNYTGAGWFNFNPVHVLENSARYFDFAKEETDCNRKAEK